MNGVAAMDSGDFEDGLRDALEAVNRSKQEHEEAAARLRASQQAHIETILAANDALNLAITQFREDRQAFEAEKEQWRSHADSERGRLRDQEDEWQRLREHQEQDEDEHRQGEPNEEPVQEDRGEERFAEPDDSYDRPNEGGRRDPDDSYDRPHEGGRRDPDDSYDRSQEGGWRHAGTGARGNFGHSERPRSRSRSLQRVPKFVDRSGQQSVESAIMHLRLDDSASRSLRQLPPDSALRILDQVDRGVRNPSAFVMAMANNALKGSGGDGSPLAEQIEALGLDLIAAGMLRDLPQDQARRILEGIGDGVRNPSAFVTAEVRKLHSRDSRGGGYPPDSRGSGYPPEPPRAPPNPPQHPPRLAPPPHAPPPHGPPRDLPEEKMIKLAKSLDLDGDSINVLHTISIQEAVSVLKKLAANLEMIRNRSAFVFSEVKKRKADGQAQSSWKPGPQKSVPCKFWAEGWCQNGSECRFSHEG